MANRLTYGDSFYSIRVTGITQHLKWKNEMIIKVRIKNVFGTDRVYPACENAFAFTQITETKTLTPAAIEVIKALGYKVEVKTQSL